jgi:hypothetical protein
VVVVEPPKLKLGVPNVVATAAAGAATAAVVVGAAVASTDAAPGFGVSHAAHTAAESEFCTMHVSHSQPDCGSRADIDVTFTFGASVGAVLDPFAFTESDLDTVDVATVVTLGIVVSGGAVKLNPNDGTAVLTAGTAVGATVVGTIAVVGAVNANGDAAALTDDVGGGAPNAKVGAVAGAKLNGDGVVVVDEGGVVVAAGAANVKAPLTGTDATSLFAGTVIGGTGVLVKMEPNVGTVDAGAVTVGGTICCCGCTGRCSCTCSSVSSSDSSCACTVF